jgi:phospholipid transport system substrate-binding protein
MKIFNRLITIMLAFATLSFAGGALAQQEDPQALVKRVSQDVLATAKTDKEIQSGNQQHVLAVVEEKILPYVDFQRMTSLAAGRFWREATPEQQKHLVDEFRKLLVYTYSGAITQIREQELEFKPMRGNPAEGEVEVRSQVVQPRGEPLQLNYRLYKTPDGWKIYDMNVLGAWLVETYKGNFASEISRGGIDGLIKALAERNKKLAATAGKQPPKPRS